MKKNYDVSKCFNLLEELRAESQEWISEWKQISNYLLPGRGIYQYYSQPRKRKLTSPYVVNPVAEDALHVLTSGMHGALTSPSRPWFKLEWTDQRIQDMDQMKFWLQDSTKQLHTALQRSNFYSIISSFYDEYAGFGTACTYVGEDSHSVHAPFRFELLTAGEYFFSMSSDSTVDVFIRPIFMTAVQLVDKFPDTASEEIKKKVDNNETGIYSRYITVLELIVKEPYKGQYGDEKPYTQIYYEMTSSGPRGKGATGYKPIRQDQKPLSKAGFHEFPYPLARWSTIGSDQLGIGPGSRALPHIKRLQEVEKSLLMATHKYIDPPLNIPSRMTNLNSLPGGRNYYSNPNEMVKPLYDMRLDINAAAAMADRIEQTIRSNFFNDIFLTASRDPNASPLRTGQVEVQQQEKMLRLGPVVERLQHEYLYQVINRCFQIMLRKDLFAPLPPELQGFAGEYNIALVSPLATAQRSVALQGINSFMAFIGNAAQFNQEVMDNVDPDAAAQEYGNITGVEYPVLRSKEQVDKIRSDRQKALAAQQQKEEMVAAAQMASQMDGERASAMKTQAEAGETLLKSQETANEIGII